MKTVAVVVDKNWVSSYASENLSYILYTCADQEDFRNIQNKLAQNCTDSVSKNSTVTMRTVLTINFFFPFSQKLQLLQETTRIYTDQKDELTV